jgi:hypothetical protein
MSNSFLRESKLYIEYGGTKYRIYTSSAVSLDQTFAEDSYSVKTLHDQSKMFEGSIINKANPASFGFEIPLTIEQDESVIIELLGGLTAGQLNEFNIYLVTTSSTFKLENAIITSASMDFIPENPFMIRIEGEGTKVSRVGDENFTVDDAEGADSAFIALTPPTAIGSTPSNYWTIDGSNQLPSSTRTPLMVYPVITATPSGGSSLNMNNIISVNFQLENDINWTNYTTLHNSLSSNTMFPSAYTVEKRTASGEIRQYQTDNNITQFDDFSTNTNLTITAKNISGDADFFQVTINPVMYTARMDVADVFTQSYDFRSLDNTNPVDTTQITYS